MKLQTTPALKPSYWRESIDTITPRPALQGTEHADITIIGGGYVGLWTALTIKQHEPDCNVALLEQHLCGDGASGRNGGFVMSWWPKIGTLRSFCSDEQALFLANSAEQAISELGEFCQEHDIDAHFLQKGWLWTATTPAHIDSWRGTLKVCERLGVRPFELVKAEDLKRRTGSDKHLAGVFEASNATVQPAALVQGMRRVALEAGVRIFERSGVTDIEPGAPVLVSTAGGKISTNKVILCNNAWAASIPQLSRLITPVNSSIVTSQPLGQRLDQIGWIDGESITDSQLMVNYYRTTRDGRIAFGKGTGALSYNGKINEVFSEHPQSIEMTRHDFLGTYTSLSEADISHSWSGPVDRTYDSLPAFGHLSGNPDIVYGIGWSGNGVGPGRIGGRILASLALERRDEWSQCALVGRHNRTFPPEPFRYLGGTLVRNAVIRKERAEMQGAAPSKIDLLLASLAPAGLEDKS
ncbi:Glycine/D-amino acid oxidase [Halopseudomonas litoralis]|uniref:Glycine/D-amino acid oxidase n=1 Tax=Halopseudomonas litoralis TaxID=797277 RepID=A0A1H1QHV9_9GAMM|nr:FAD-binding oxidoreductase [Halopseudomonas litoralis]SDS23058.1 Glycine/D-amino acid oxidase [Halopseudomonas litoralis]